MSALAFAQPHFLWLLSLLPLLWWHARRSRRGATQWTGALSLWRRAVLPSDSSDARRRDSLPRYMQAALGALALGILALAGPERVGAKAQGPQWVFVLDRSPSMFLEVEGPAPRVTRIARAMQLALELCQRENVGPERREWLTFAADGEHRMRAERPPDEWLATEWGIGASTPWGQVDTPRHVWVSDCSPAIAPVWAGRVHSGAVPAPGAIADLGEMELFWDGAQVLERPRVGARAGLFLGAELPEAIATLARLWADGRGISIASESDRRCLSIESVATNLPIVEGRAQGVGWSAPARAACLPRGDDGIPWSEFVAADGPRGPAAIWRSGKIKLALTSLAAEEADPAAFALCWSELFDRARAPDGAVVSYGERALQGAPRVEPPRAPPSADSREATELAALPALLAAALALLSLHLARSR